jgi:hypothetical protein
MSGLPDDKSKTGLGLGLGRGLGVREICTHLIKFAQCRD